MGEAVLVVRRKAMALVILLALGASLTVAPGCYHYRVTAFKADDPVIQYSETRHQLFWGLVGDAVLLSPDAEDPSRRCESNSLYEVRVSTNLGHALVTVLTLGIWAPATVEWTCATVAPIEGELPIPGVDDGAVEEEVVEDEVVEDGALEDGAPEDGGDGR